MSGIANITAENSRLRRENEELLAALVACVEELEYINIGCGTLKAARAAIAKATAKGK